MGSFKPSEIEFRQLTIEEVKQEYPNLLAIYKFWFPDFDDFILSMIISIAVGVEEFDQKCGTETQETETDRLIAERDHLLKIFETRQKNVRVILNLIDRIRASLILMRDPYPEVSLHMDGFRVVITRRDSWNRLYKLEIFDSEREITILSSFVFGAGFGKLGESLLGLNAIYVDWTWQWDTDCRLLNLVTIAATEYEAMVLRQDIMTYSQRLDLPVRI